MKIIPGGYSFAEFDTDPNFSNPIRIEGLLKSGTGFTPKTMSEEGADNKPMTAAKGVDLTIRSNNVDQSVGSAYALLKQYEESQTLLHFRFVKILGDVLSIHNCDAAWDEYVAANVASLLETTAKKEGIGSALITSTGGFTGPVLLATEAISKDLSTVKAIRLWANAWQTGITNRGDYQLLIDNTAQCASPLQAFNLPPMVPDEWKELIFVLNDPASLNNIISIGVKWNTGANWGGRIIFDDIRGVDAVISVIKNATVNVVFEKNEAGKFNAMRVTGGGLADTEENLLSNNF